MANLVDQFTYFGCNISFTESDVSVCLAKVWNAIDKLSIIWIYFVMKKKLEGTFAYLLNMTMWNDSENDHDIKLKKFLMATKWKNLTYNESKCIFSSKKIKILE